MNSLRINFLGYASVSSYRNIAFCSQTKSGKSNFRQKLILLIIPNFMILTVIF